MKTNIQEMNYRFIKALLNDASLKAYFKLYHKLHSIEEGVPDTFNYDAWCKGLFNGEVSISLDDYLDMMYEDYGLTIEKGFFDDPYERGNLVDLIDMNSFKNNVFILWSQVWDDDITKLITEANK